MNSASLTYINTVKKFIDLIGVKVTFLSLRDKLKYHPNAPYLTSIEDTLSDFKIDNLVIKIPDKNLSVLEEITTPFLAQKNDDELIIIKNISDNRITFINTGLKEQTEFISDFQEKWSGVLLLANPTNTSGEKDYLSNRIKESLPTIISTLFFSTFLLIIIVNLINGLITPIILLLIKIIGLAICGIIVKFNINSDYSIAKALCKIGKKEFNCNSILQSDASKAFGLISWADLGIIYFLGGILIIINSHQYIYTALSVLFLINIPTILFSFYSIYYQFFKTQTKCLLCLYTIFLFWLEFLFFIIIGFPKDLFLEDLVSVLISGIVPFLISLGLWLFIKPRIISHYKEDNTRLINQYLLFHPLLVN